MPNKLTLRKKYRELRAAIDADARQESARAAAQLLVSHPLFTASRHIACYHAYGDEFETHPIFSAIWQANKVCYLPVLNDTKDVTFAQYNDGDELQLNQHLIPEPVSRQHIIHAEKLDLVLVPLLAFDLNGNRLGTGGGYYDRTFAFIFAKPEKSPTLIGLGFDIQQCQEMISEPWDIKLQGVLTEKKLIVF